MVTVRAVCRLVSGARARAQLDRQGFRFSWNICS
jgi:hypothetical protein